MEKIAENEEEILYINTKNHLFDREKMSLFSQSMRQNLEIDIEGPNINKGLEVEGEQINKMLEFYKKGSGSDSLDSDEDLCEFLVLQPDTDAENHYPNVPPINEESPEVEKNDKTPSPSQKKKENVCNARTSAVKTFITSANPFITNPGEGSGVKEISPEFEEKRNNNAAMDNFFDSEVNLNFLKFFLVHYNSFK